MKPRACQNKSCNGLFTPSKPMQRVCSAACAIIVASEKRSKINRQELAERKLAMKSRSQWLDEAQSAFNQFIRARDADLPCISCGRFHTGAYDAGHYRSRGSMPALRFNEDNTHKQCVPCNQFKSGNVIEYRLRLVAKIGIDRLEFLERDHPAAKYTIDQAKEIKAMYKAKFKALKDAT